ncbi:hypothetical protein KKB55_21245 [Myxococcota bacterium]|nr:hypothetical protein [Myxococcota bacterium]MBU1900275.1 hypothetical protein [Myxococcota bacterium]
MSACPLRRAAPRLMDFAMKNSTPWRRAALLLILLLALPACGKVIGDECISDLECDTGQVCDRASEGGYCTVTPCEVGACPDDGVCVTFEDGRSWCMARCDDSGDCRDGYACDKSLADHGFCRQRG